MLQKGVSNEQWIARSADLRTRSSSFEHSVDTLHRIVAAHHGYFEDLRTESRSGFGRGLAAALAVPSDEFDNTLAELKSVGRIESISQAGEDSAVQLANAARHLTAAQTNLVRLKKLQRERQGELRDALALEKDIAQANESVAEAERQHETLLSTVTQAHIRLTLLEDYRAPLQVSLAGASLQIRNSFVEGASAIFSMMALFLSVLLSYGLPMAFWSVLLFVPLRALYRWFRRRHSDLQALPAVH
jgi:VIT1/CCC1 family predicted Fe2+/Mn2+ transporter